MKRAHPTSALASASTTASVLKVKNSKLNVWNGGAAMKKQKSAGTPKRDALVAPNRSITASQSQTSLTHSQSAEIERVAEREFSALMKRAFGTEDHALQERLFEQVGRSVPDVAGHDKKSLDPIVAGLEGIHPLDALEGMLAVQMVSIHNMAMECMRRAATPEQSDLLLEAYINRATKLMRMFAAQTEALGRHRGKGQQKMTVEHVHVYKGGQAIVGQVSPQNNAKQAGGQFKPKR